MNLYSNDPVSGKPSVTLTLVWINLIVLIAAEILEMAAIIKTTSVVAETFWGCLAAYVGRRFTSGSKTLEAGAKE